VVRVDPLSGDYTVLTQRQLQSSSLAIVYPALATNSLADVGFSVETGGASQYETHAVGILADPTLRLTTVTSSAGTTRFGDYVTIRPDVAQPKLFDAFGYGVETTVPQPNTRFVVYGRPPTPTYDEVEIGITTGNDDAEKSEIRATLAGQKVPLCLKPSNDSGMTPDGVCFPGGTDQNGSNDWSNFTFDGDQTFKLDTPQTATSGFPSIEITLAQDDPTCDLSCDNWDLQGITVTVKDSTGTLPPKVLVNVLATPESGNDCFARLKGTAQGNSGAVRIGLSASHPTTPTHTYVGGTFNGETTSCSNNGGS
jgi:hypothetical protein